MATLMYSSMGVYSFPTMPQGGGSGNNASNNQNDGSGEDSSMIDIRVALRGGVLYSSITYLHRGIWAVRPPGWGRGTGICCYDTFWG